MAELNVKLKVPTGYEQEVKRVAKEINFEKLFVQALARSFEVELKKELLRRIASKSKLTEEQALKFGEEIKEGIAKRHGVVL